jgi:glucan phosphoethanolaminetransferase (alkaline phosphatase superfamily)
LVVESRALHTFGRHKQVGRFIFTWIAACGLILLVQHFRTFTVVSFEIQVREAASGPYLHPCFYYDTGSGFSEAEKTCFEYNRHPISEFQSYRIVLPVRRPVRQLRFDPLEEPGIVALRKVAVGRTRFTADAFRFAAVNLAREFGRTVVPLHTVALTQEGDTLVARLTGDDPYFMLMSNGLRRRAVLALRALLQAAAISLVFSIALVLLFRLRARIWTGPPRYRDALRRYVPTLATSARSVSLAALTAFVVTTISAKVFAILTSALRYGRPIAVTNLVAAPAESMAIGLLALAAVLIIMRADRICAGHSWMAPVRVLLAGTQFLISLTLVIFALFEILCSYVFWEWGSYVDGSLILLAYESPTPDSLHYYLTRTPAAVAALAGVAMLMLFIFAVRIFRRRQVPQRIVIAFASIAAIWSLGALSPMRAPAAYDPSVSSPIVLAFQTGPDISGGLDPKIAPPDLASFHFPPPRPVPAAYQHYRGAAAGQDVIFVVLESVRRANISLYGYPRETTPYLSRLSHHAMVFSNVYVAQPRSAKTMESFTLGTYPDPRIGAVNYDPERILGRPTFWGTLANRGYKGYLGVNANPESDHFAPFMKAAFGPALERITGNADLVAHYGEAARPPGTMGSDTILVDDFLQWYQQKKEPVAAVIWFAGAHHPYWATTKKFPEHNIIDQYDNCIYSSDIAIGHLIDGIEKTGRHPLVLIFGDHGEALGEHAGDQLHGTYLYNQSVRIPMVLYSPTVFAERQDFAGRFSMKDVPATMLYFLGYDQQLGQSEVAFSKQPDDPVYMSNVYGDFKLGMVSGLGPEKFMYLPNKNLGYLFDLATDPSEHNNIVASRPADEINQREHQLIQWYFYQIQYLEQAFPRRMGAETATATTPVLR